MSNPLQSNAHVHTTWCDGAQTPKEMIEAALSKRFFDLGFSSHAPPAIKGPGHGISDIPAYIGEISNLKNEYEGRLFILCGAEQDSYAKVDREKFDYIIHSEHSLSMDSGVYYPIDHTPQKTLDTFKTRYGGNGLLLAEDYFKLLAEGVKTYSPDIVGHFDLIAKFNSNSLMFDEDSKDYRSLALSYLDEIITCVNGYGGMIEINTSGIRYKGTPYPYAGTPYMLKRLYEKKTRVIITGDSHSSDMLDYMFPQTLELLKSIGFSSLAVLSGGRFCDIKI